MAVTPEQEQEMRAHFQAVLRANRELGPDYERIAVDQLMERVRASADRTAPPPPDPGARVDAGVRAARCRGWGGPWAILGLIAAALWVVPAVVGAAGGIAAFVVIAVVGAAVLRRFVWRWGGGPWGDPSWGPGPWRYARRRRWDW